MQFTTGTLTACSGGEHLTLPVTIAGQQHTLNTTVAEVFGLKPEGFEEIRTAIIQRLRSAKLEAGATTNVQIRNAVSNKTFEV